MILGDIFIAAAIASALIARKMQGIYKSWRELAKEEYEEAITRRDIVSNRLMLKLAEKYGPGKTVFLLDIIMIPITSILLLVVNIALGVSLIGALIRVLTFIIISVPMTMGVMYYLMKEEVRQNSERENEGDRTV